MSDISIISVLVFLALTLAIEAGYWMTWRAYRVQLAMRRRLASNQWSTNNDRAASLRRETLGLEVFQNPLLQPLNAYLVQSGLRIERKTLLILGLSFAAVLFGGLGPFAGFGFLTFTVALLLATAAIALFVGSIRHRRITRFGELLPDSIDVLVRGLRVGYPLPAALGLVARELPDPVGSEFGLVCEELSFGRDLHMAIDHLYRRVGQDDLPFLIMAINIQSQTGGNLADILANLARLLRNRAKVALKIRALSADGRMSGLFLSVIPFVLFGLIVLISPSYFAEVRDHPLVGPALIYAAISLVLGNIVMYRMINFKL